MDLFLNSIFFECTNCNLSKHIYDGKNVGYSLSPDDSYRRFESEPSCNEMIMRQVMEWYGA